MSIFLTEKVVSALPNPLSPDTVYFVRAGDGFDLYVTDATGSIAYTPNRTGGVIGQPFLWSGPTPPAGSLEYDGSVIEVVDYPELVAVLDAWQYVGTYSGVAWNFRCSNESDPANTKVVGGDFFKLMDARGRFPRFFDNGRGLDLDRSTTASFYSGQDDEFKEHDHPLTMGFRTSAATLNGGRPENCDNVGLYDTDLPIGNRGGSETRPTNVPFLVCVWYE